MKWKDDLKQMLIGIPLFWIFAIAAGYGLYFINSYYWFWLLLIFVGAPVTVVVRNYLKNKKKKKDPRY